MPSLPAQSCADVINAPRSDFSPRGRFDDRFASWRLSSKKEDTLWGVLLFGAGYGNRFAFSPLAKIMVATSVCTGGWNCPPDSSTAIGSIPVTEKRRTPRWGVLFFGAGYGNRTRLHGLGSRCITDIRTLRWIYHIIAEQKVNINSFLSRASVEPCRKAGKIVVFIQIDPFGNKLYLLFTESHDKMTAIINRYIYFIVNL